MGLSLLVTSFKGLHLSAHSISGGWQYLFVLSHCWQFLLSSPSQDPQSFLLGTPSDAPLLQLSIHILHVTLKRPCQLLLPSSKT